MSLMILVIRHGKTDWNEGGRWQGAIDTDLSAVGRAQAEQLAAWLTKRHSAGSPAYPPLRAVYSSDLRRAADTAAVLAARAGLPVQVDARWREIDMGRFQGLTYAEICARFPREVEHMETGDLDFVFPEGETRRHLQARAYDALRDAAAAHHGQTGTLAIVTHGGTIRLLMRRLLDDAPESLGPLHIHNTSILTLWADGDGFRIESPPATPHLESVSAGSEL
jgi:broad specificity phosphatase PhoE